MQLIELLGRLHPLVLHFPIGILLLAFLFELLSRREKHSQLRPATGITLMLGCVSAVVTAVFGYILSLESGYGGDLLDLHQWSGIIVAVLSIVLVVVRRKSGEDAGAEPPSYYMPLWYVTILCLLLTGHLGGSLTHGEDFVTEKLPQPLRSLAGYEEPSEMVISADEMDSLHVYEQIVYPVLDRTCLGCHNPVKKKGELLLNTPEGILAGGDGGSVLSPGDAENSSLYSRMILPADHDDHMPPPGKKQPDAQEIALIGWWINQGAQFDAKLASLQVPESIEAILQDRMKPANPLLALEIDAADEDYIEAARMNNIKVAALSQDTPYLTARVLPDISITNKMLESLEDLGEQIVILYLSRSQIVNSQLEVLENLPHLQKLYLDHTAVNDSALDHVQGLKYLEYLNLVGTDVTDDGLTALESLERLEQIYLWESQATEAGVERLVAAIPAVYADLGFSLDSLFGPSRLRPPLVLYETTIFENELEVEAKVNLGTAEIRYTLDGTDPDTTSKLWDDKLNITTSARLRVGAFSEGWDPSEIVEHVFIKPRYKVENVSLKKPPHEKYYGRGGPALIDYVKGDQGYAGGLWLGWEAEDLEATLDMGAVKPISQVSVSCLEDVGSWIFYPLSINVELAGPDKKFRQAGQLKLPDPDGGTPPTNRFFPIEFEETAARYVRVYVENVKANPDWHPNPGGKSWVFVDEILVE